MQVKGFALLQFRRAWVGWNNIVTAPTMHRGSTALTVLHSSPINAYYARADENTLDRGMRYPGFVLLLNANETTLPQIRYLQDRPD